MDATPKLGEGRRSALVVAHPGHELLVHRWLEQAKPLVFVLTAGLTRSGTAAVATTAKIVERAGARVSSLFGRFTDQGLHQALLMHERERFNALVQELADAFLEESIDIVVGDAAEGCDPAHDLCRIVLDAAWGIAAKLRPDLGNFEFPLFGSAAGQSQALIQRIEGAAWARKLASCQSYEAPVDEVQVHLDRDGDEALRDECVRPAKPWAIQRRRDVLYTHPVDRRIPAIQFSEHVLPVAGSVERFVAAPRSWAA